MITIDEAYQFIFDSVTMLNSQLVSLDESVGRVLAKPVISDVDSPPHYKSLMDGFAVISNDINAKIRRLEVVETIVAGGWPSKSIGTGQAARIMTGAPLPKGADAIVMIEKTSPETVDNQTFVNVQLDHVEPGHHLAPRADNFSAGHALFLTGHRIRPSDVGLLAEAGAAHIEVTTRPSIAILPTGDELVDCSQLPLRGQIRNSNGPMLAALARNLGLNTTQLPIARDNAEQLAEQISIGLSHNILLLTGGVSEGLLDLVPKTLKQLGVQEVFHKIRMKPGKPLWFGTFSRRDQHSTSCHSNSINGNSELPTHQNQSTCYVFGLPGNPVSSLVGFQLFVRTAIRTLEGVGQSVSNASSKRQERFEQCRPTRVLATLTREHESRGDRPTYWPGKLLTGPSLLRQVEPLAWKGSSDLRSLGQAEGLIYFSCEKSLTLAGEEVLFHPFYDQW